MNPSISLCLRVLVCDDRVMISAGHLVSLAWHVPFVFFYLPCSSLFLSFITCFFSDVYENVYFHGLILYIWVSLVLYHSIAIVMDISSHVVKTERKKRDQYTKQNKHNHLYKLASYF